MLDELLDEKAWILEQIVDGQLHSVAQIETMNSDYYNRMQAVKF
jgi:hypothetical protein